MLFRSLELVVAVEAKFGPKARSRRPARGVAAEGELGGDRVAIKTDTEDGEEHCEVVAYAVDVLLSVGELGEGRDAVARQEAMVRSFDGD